MKSDDGIFANIFTKHRRNYIRLTKLKLSLTSASVEIQLLGKKVDFTEIRSFVPFWVELDRVNRPNLGEN